MSGTGVGVLLPLRLETRFLAPREDPAHPGTTGPDIPDEWRIRVRVMPDEIGTDRHDPFVSAAERLGLEAMWGALTLLPDPDKPARSAALASDDIGWTDAFGRLAAQVGKERAAWLVRTVPVSRLEGEPAIAAPAPADETRQGAPVWRGLPNRLDVWVVWKSGPPTAAEVLGQLSPKPELADPLTVPRAADLALWECARDAGLAVELRLGPRTPDEISLLGVSGLGPLDGTTPEQLLQAHADAGRLAVLPPGEATSTLRGDPTVTSIGSNSLWMIRDSTDPSGTVDALAGSGGSVFPVQSENAIRDEEGPGSFLSGVCFPALYGYGLTGPLGVLTIEEVGPLWEWSHRWLRPEGNYASLRVGDQVYGVLPVAFPDRLAGAGLPGLSGVEPVLPMLGRMVPRFAEVAESDGGLVGGGVADAVRTVRRGPVPGGVGWFRGRDWALNAAITSWEAAAGGDVVAAVVEAMEAWDSENRPTREVLGGTAGPRRRYGARGGIGRLRIPELGPGLDDPDGPPVEDRALLETVEEVGGALQPTWFGVDGEERRVVLGRGWDTLPESLLVRLYLRSLAVAGSQLAVLAAQRQPQHLPDPGVPMTLIDPPIGGRNQLTAQLRKLNEVLGLLSRVNIDDPLAAQIIWLADAHRELVDRLFRASDEPSTRRPLLRALRALVEASANRWDVWLTGVGAATVDANPGTRVLGAYGWVDTPFRGAPGPGPGGFLMAPSQDHAATAAVLRDASIRDADPDRWKMQLDSDTVGPAQRMVAALADGWHPAEWTGRMIERGFADSQAVNDLARREGLDWLRKWHPLREGQGAFGCCHGLDVLADLGALETTPLWQSATADHRAALLEAVGRVAEVTNAVADLVLAEGVHEFLAGHPARAGVATKVLAGNLAPGRLDVLDPSRPGSSVRTVVFAALPMLDNAVPPSGGVAATAAPGFDALLVNRFGEPTDWEFTLRLRGGNATLNLADLGLRPADCVTHSNASLKALATLVVAARGETRTVRKVILPEGLAASRKFARLLRGRAADPDDLAIDRSDVARAEAARDSAMAALMQRLKGLAGRAQFQVTDLDEAVKSARTDPPTVPDPAQLAQLVVSAAGWGASIPPEAAYLFSENDQERAAANAAVLGALERTVGDLRARIHAAQSAVDAGGLARGTQSVDGKVTSLATVAEALARLVGDAAVPIGAVLPMNLIPSALVPTAGTLAERRWLPAIAKVRPRLAELASGFKGRNPALAGMAFYASEPEDPWRVDALADGAASAAPQPPPRLEVALSEAAPDGNVELIVLDTFGETVPNPASALGFAFDAATPGAAPPSAVLLVPPPDPSAAELTAADLPAAVLQARAMARMRMVDPSSLAEAGLGPLSAFAALPQYDQGGLPVTPQGTESLYEDVAFLQPMRTHADTEDVIRAVTADPLWMLGVQWRLGEHLGEDAASPARVDSTLAITRLSRRVARKPFEATVESAETWDRSELAYTATVQASESELTVRRHPGGPADWWAMTANSVPTGMDDEAKSVPSRLNWPGAPRRRYWQVDDPRRDPAGVGPDAAHPATLHLIRLLARHGDDWYVAPLAAPLGTVVRPTEVILIDAAGGHWTLRTPPDWSLFAVNGLDPEPPAGGDENWHRALPVLASAVAALHGPISDEIGFAVDEEANLVWAAILRTNGVEPPPTELPPTPLRSSVPDDGPLEVEWQLAGGVPTNRIAYLYGRTIEGDAYGNGQDRFVQAAFLDPLLGTPLPVPTSPIIAPRTPGDTPHTIEPLALPSSGVRIVEQRVLARDVNGRPVRWRRRTIVPLDTTVDVPMHWDLYTRRTE